MQHTFDIKAVLHINATVEEILDSKEEVITVYRYDAISPILIGDKWFSVIHCGASNFIIKMTREELKHYINEQI